MALPLSERDREYARTRHAEVASICAVDPDAPPWLEIFYRLTILAMDSENPATVLCQAVEAEDSDPAEVCRALAAMERTANEWAEWWPARHLSPN